MPRLSCNRMQKKWTKRNITNGEEIQNSPVNKSKGERGGGITHSDTNTESNLHFQKRDYIVHMKWNNLLFTWQKVVPKNTTQFVKDDLDSHSGTPEWRITRSRRYFFKVPRQRNTDLLSNAEQTLLFLSDLNCGRDVTHQRTTPATIKPRSLKWSLPRGSLICSCVGAGRDALVSCPDLPSLWYGVWALTSMRFCKNFALL